MKSKDDILKIRATVLYLLNKFPEGVDYIKLFKIIYFAQQRHLSTYGRVIINETFHDVFGKDLRKTLGTEEYKKMILEVANQEKINQIMNINEEYPGVDAGPKGLGWLLGLATSGLALLGILIGKLLSAGKQQIAIVMLRRYMKKLVELIDNGTNKKKTLLKGVVQRLAGVGTKYNG